MALRRAFFSTRNSEDEYQREGQYTQSNAAQRGTHIHACNRKRFDTSQQRLHDPLPNFSFSRRRGLPLTGGAVGCSLRGGGDLRLGLFMAVALLFVQYDARTASPYEGSSLTPRENLPRPEPNYCLTKLVRT